MKRVLVVSTIALAACGKLLGLSEEEEPPHSRVDAAPPNDAGSETNVADGETAADGGPDQERVVFVTGQSTEGDFGGLAAGDARCNSEAANGVSRVKGRTFVAWLSAPDASVAVRHVQGTKPYILPSGAKVANNWAELLRRRLDQPIDERADSTRVDAGTRVWTGTQHDGGATINHCLSWTKTTDSERGTTGTVGATEDWTQSNTDPCTLDAHIYCIEK